MISRKEYFQVQLAAITGLSSRSDLNPWEIDDLSRQIANHWVEGEKKQRIKDGKIND